MYEIQNDVFYDFIRPYDSEAQYHFAGEVDYHLLKSDKPYEGLQSHRDALRVVFEHLTENSIEDQKSIRERWGDDTEDQLSPLIFDMTSA